MTATPCPSCRQPKPTGKYLCFVCWFTLPDPAQRALNRRDRHAHTRLRELHQQLDRDVPLADIRVTP